MVWIKNIILINYKRKRRTKVTGSVTGATELIFIFVQCLQQGTVVLHQDILSLLLPKDLKAYNSLRSNK
jgi:hypothetical protein